MREKAERNDQRLVRDMARSAVGEKRDESSGNVAMRARAPRRRRVFVERGMEEEEGEGEGEVVEEVVVECGCCVGRFSVGLGR